MVECRGVCVTYVLLQAEAITLTVAQAFNIAYEKWQVRVSM